MDRLGRAALALERGPGAHGPGEQFLQHRDMDDPAIGRPSSTSAMFTVNSPLRLMNSFVPSSGSTSQKRRAPAAAGPLVSTVSSDTTGISGVNSRRAETIRRSASSSAMVSGEASALARTPWSP